MLYVLSQLNGLSKLSLISNGSYSFTLSVYNYIGGYS